MKRIDWMPSAAPVDSGAATTVQVHARIVHQLAEAHDIQLGVAAVLIRPMLADMIRTGTWHYRMDNGQYRLSHGPAGECHQFAWHATGTSQCAIKYYDALHPEHECPAQQPLPDVPVPSWLPHFLDPGPPPRGIASPWQHVLRTASQLPVTLLKPALRYFAQHRLNLSEVTPDTFATVFFAMASEALLVHGQWNGLPGSTFLTDSTGLIWQLSSTSQGSRKPAITGVLPPSARPADKPNQQRARRTPSSPFLTSQRRPY